MEEDIFNSELGRKILALMKASFKVSDLISDLVFREKIKHQILEVYKSFFVLQSKNYQEFLREIDILDNYLYLGGHLNLIKEEHLKQLRNGFLVFKSHIILAANQKLQSLTSDADNLRVSDEKEKVVDVRRREILDIGRQALDKVNDRQKKILEKFHDKNILKLSEIMEFFPDISERTIRNELVSLINLKMLTRSGQGSGSFYEIVRQ